MKKSIITIFLSVVLSLSIAVQAQTSPPPPIAASSAVEAAANVRQETFDIVWTTVKEKHFDPDFGGVDWNRVREKYAPKAAAVKTDQELYSVLQQMLGELGQSHFHIIPPEAIVQDDSKEPKGGGIGVDIRLIDGRAMISRVEEGSAAAVAGLRPGFIIQKVDDTTVDQIAARFSKSAGSAAITKTRITRATLARINGLPGTNVRLTYLDGANRAREVSVAREKLKGEMSPRFGNFPPQYTEFESGRIAGGIGYIRFNVFVTSVMDRIRSAVRSLSDSQGLIIDLRGNPGGVGGMAAGIAGVLETRQTSLGVMRYRKGHSIFVVFPQKDPYLGPVVILVDGGSASTSEIFAAGMQEIGRGIVVGERTMGAALPSVFGKLPTGALFQYAIADYRTPKGVLIEGRGVTPDVEVKLTRRALLEGRDPQLQAAIQQIMQSQQRKVVTAR